MLAVVGVIAFIDGGAHLVGAATEEPAGPPRDVGGVVRVQPRSGWEAEEPRDLGNVHELTIVNGSVELDVVAVEGPPGAPGDLANRYIDQILRPRFDRLTIGQPEQGTLASGVPAIRFGYVGITSDGASTEGVVTVAATTANGAVFDAFAPKGDLVGAAPDLESMIGNAAVA